ncbi:hypothetical protein P154DRAFT_578477 [Amniculicola lignicola CBS 123094]|uniref:RING-type domain-containing protein n=1 Tax=Amniculicola lignicola CBS 123094 TaxID=1392246 RepID=A0A6A5W9Z7_9PLEO|nr:hypothetical protein P154DRAFT_578477 [Amniculicola lignicola CBS 123094]
MPGPNDPYAFRGGGSVLKPNHMTRYLYPCLLGYPASSFRLQIPKWSTHRRRPQGQGAFDKTFITLTRAANPPPNLSQFKSWILAETAKDKHDENPIGRAMKRVTRYPGNTLLESGKFKLKRGDEGLFYIVKRTTSLVLGGDQQGQVAVDEDCYGIPCARWRELQPYCRSGPDSWWVRLYDLYNSSSDRAFFAVREQMTAIKIVAPIVQWLPRPDIEEAVQVDCKDPLPEDDLGNCIACSDDWDTESEVRCKLKCGHFLCLECVTLFVDQADRKGLQPGEENLDPGIPFWRCPYCRHFHTSSQQRADMITPAEFGFWKWYLTDIRFKHDIKYSWDMWLMVSENEGHIPNFSHNLPPSTIHMNVAKARVNAETTLYIIEQGIIPAAGFLNWGYPGDNPIDFPESAALLAVLKRELHRLEQTGQLFLLNDLLDHMKDVGLKAFIPVVAGTEKERLGNPVYPPGYEAYREYLCEWTARAVFIGPQASTQLMAFLFKMREEPGKVWWKGKDITVATE